MQLVKFLDAGSPHVGLLDAGFVRAVRKGLTLSSLLASPDPGDAARLAAEGAEPRPVESLELLAPIDDQEVWGAGVTYLRSKVAREEESESGGSFYDLVYSADRPELFFKATPSRVVGPRQNVRVRSDTRWCVPEPELALVLDPSMRWVGCTIGNDMSARDIEGRNPLYLPQAKVYDACCALGPGITLMESIPDPADLGIRLVVRRAGKEIVDETTRTSRMARRFEELISWLRRDNLFPAGAVLLTGTGIVPPDDFSLEAGDEVEISIDGLGTLSNGVVRASS